jgi:hypothetical protein
VIGSMGFFVLGSHLIGSGISLAGYSLNIFSIFFAYIALAILSLNSDAYSMYYVATPFSVANTTLSFKTTTYSGVERPMSRLSNSNYRFL